MDNFLSSSLAWIDQITCATSSYIDALHIAKAAFVTSGIIIGAVGTVVAVVALICAAVVGGVAASGGFTSS